MDGIPETDKDFTFSREDLFNRYDNEALETLLRTSGEVSLARLAKLDAVDPAWATGWLQWVYGTIHSRGVLDLKTRGLVALGQHVIMSNDRGVAANIKSALRSGASHEEVVEVILQSSAYAGFPPTHRALDLYRTMRDSGELDNPS